MRVRDRAQRSSLRGLLLAVLLLPLHPSSTAAVPPPFEGELGVCSALTREVALRANLAEAVEKVLRGYGSSDPELLASIYRAALKNAITLCRRPASEVVDGALRARVPVDVIVAGALDAGMTPFEARGLLLAAGVPPAVLAAAVTEAQRRAGRHGPVLPNVIDLQGGLGGPFSSPLVQPPTSQFVP